MLIGMIGVKIGGLEPPTKQSEMPQARPRRQRAPRSELKLLERADHILATIINTLQKRKTGRRPMPRESGTKTKFPIPMHSDGYEARSEINAGLNVYSPKNNIFLPVSSQSLEGRS